MNSIVSFRKCTLSDADLIEKIDKLTDEMYQTGKMPYRQIPARPDEDFDLLIGELIYRVHHKELQKESVLNQENDIEIVGYCANCGVEYHIHKTENNG